VDFKNNYIPLYYNAWENDEHNNVLESLIYSFLNEYPKYKDEINSIDLKDFFNGTLKNLVSTITGGLVSKELFDEAKDFESLAESINTIEEKKLALNELYNRLVGNKRLLLIIDELDRCKPDYAVRVLETIKHFYSNDNMTILVVTDNVRLAETIKHFYGYGINGCEYLNRIYDNVFSINSQNIAKYVFNYSDLPKESYLSKDFSILLFKYFDFSYRDCNRFFSMYGMCENYIKYNKSFTPNEYIFESHILLPYVIVLKIKNTNLYESFVRKKGESELKNLIKYIRNNNKEMYKWISSILNPASEELFEETFIKRYINAFNLNGFSEYPFIEAISLFGNELIY
jgi:hypothetical protein